MNLHEEDFYAPWNVEDRENARVQREEALLEAYEARREERMYDQMRAKEEISNQFKLEI